MVVGPNCFVEDKVVVSNMLFEVFKLFELFNMFELLEFEFNCFDFSSGGEISQLDSSRGGDCCNAFNGLCNYHFKVLMLIMIMIMIMQL